MNVEVEGQDVEFPDDATQDEITAALNKQTKAALGSIPLTPYQKYTLAGGERVSGPFGPANPQEVLALPQILKAPAAAIEQTGIPESAEEIGADLLRRTGINPSAQAGVPLAPTRDQETYIPSPLEEAFPNVGKGLEAAARSFTTPGSLLAAPLLPLKPVQTAFEAQMAAGLPESTESLIKARSPEDVARSAVGVAAGLAGGLGLVRGKSELPKAVEAPKEQPVTAGKSPVEAITAPVTELVGLGGATPQEFPGSKDDLAQLTDNIKAQGQISPNEPFTSRFKQAMQTVADRWKDRPKDVSEALGRVRAGADALREAYFNLPKYTDFEKSVREWTGADNETGFEVRRFQKAINDAVPNRLRQEALTNWIQADGDEKLLAERAAASKPALRRGYEVAMRLTPAEKTLGQNIKSYLESRLDEGINAGLLQQGVDNYVTQIWKRPNPATKALWADLFGTGTLNPNFKYAKKRIFDNYFEGEQAGFTPRDKSISSLLSAYDLAFNRSLSARALIRQLHDGKASDDMPIAMVSGKTTPVGEGEVPEAFLIKPNLAPEGAVTADGRPYRPIDHWALRDWKWATKGPNGQNVFVQGDMLIHPDHWRHLNNVLKSSRLMQPEGIGHLTRPMLKAGAIAKQTKLSLSLFHLDQESLHAMAHRVNPLNLEDIDLSKEPQRELVKHGLMIADPRAQELFSEGLTGGGLVGKIPGLGRAQAAFNDLLFKDYIPRLKMNMAVDALARNTKAYAKQLASGEISMDQVMALTADEANAAFGELNYRALGRSPTLQDFFRLTLLAPDFLEARGRFVGQALKPYGREQRIALAFMGSLLYVGGRIMNQWLDNDPHWDKPFSVIYKGREYRLRTILGDVQHLLTDPRSFWFNRISPFTRALAEYATGRDDRGIKRSSMEKLRDLAAWFVPIPLQRRPDQTLGQSQIASLGVSSKVYNAQSQVFSLVDNWKKNNPDPKVQQEYEQHRQETLPQSIYRPLADALRNDDYREAFNQYRTLLKTRTPKQVEQALRVNRPFTGSLHNETQFKESLTPEQRKVYDRAVAEKQDLYTKFEAVKNSQ